MKPYDLKNKWHIIENMKLFFKIIVNTQTIHLQLSLLKTGVSAWASECTFPVCMWRKMDVFLKIRFDICKQTFSSTVSHQKFNNHKHSAFEPHKWYHANLQAENGPEVHMFKNSILHAIMCFLAELFPAFSNEHQRHLCQVKLLSVSSKLLPEQ